MKLKSLLVSGFKSFPEARLDFPQGITYFPLRVSHEVEIPPGFRIQVLS
jgi:hypothetical protein